MFIRLLMCWADIFIYCIVRSNCAGLPIRRTRCHCYNGSTGFNHPQALEPSRGWTLSSTAIVECAPVCTRVHLCARLCSCVHLCAPLCTNVHQCALMCSSLQCTSVHQSAPVCSLVHQCAPIYSHVHLCTSVCALVCSRVLLCVSTRFVCICVSTS